jgi:hypothetical protein
MQLQETEIGCQLPCLGQMSVGRAETPPESVSKRVKLAIRRRLDPNKERAFNLFKNKLVN